MKIESLPCGCDGPEPHGHEPAGVTRRQTLDGLAAGGLLAAFGTPFGGYPMTAHAAQDDVVRIGYLPITDATVLLVAHAKGFFKDEGLDAAKPTLIRGWAPMVEAFVAGKFNLVHLLKPIPVWMRYNNKFPVKIVGWAHTNGSGLVVGKHTDAKSFADLGGSSIAVPFWYSMHNIVLQMALRDAGITPVIKGEGEKIGPKEANLQVLPPPEMPPALAARKIDAYIVAEPFNALGEIKAGARMLRFTGDMWKNHPCCVLCMNEQLMQAKPEWTQAVMNALVRAAIYASENKKEVAALLSKDGAGYLPVPAPVVERAMTKYDMETYGPTKALQHPEWGNGRIDFQPWPYPSATKLIVDAMNKTVVAGDTTFLSGLDPEFVAKDLVDYAFIKSASGEISGLEKGPERRPGRSLQPRGADQAMTANAMSLPRSADLTQRSGKDRRRVADWVLPAVRSLGWSLLGIAILFALWAFGGWLIANNPRTARLFRLRARPDARPPEHDGRIGRALGNGRAEPVAGRRGPPLGGHARRAARHRRRPDQGRPGADQRAVPVPAHDLAALLDAGRRDGLFTWDGAIVFLISSRRDLADPVRHGRRRAPHRSGLVQGRPQSRRPAPAHADRRDPASHRARHPDRHPPRARRRLDRAGARRISRRHLRARLRHQRRPRHARIRPARRHRPGDRPDRLPDRPRLPAGHQARKLGPRELKPT